MPEGVKSGLAAAYVRVSTEDQAEYSPGAQLGAIREYARRNAYVLLDEYIFKDEGISGRKAEKRPAFMRMVAAARQSPSPFEVILVHKLDRFARSREDSVVYKALLRRECGVKVVSVTENIEDDKFSVILEAMLEAMAEYYSLNLGEEVKKGMAEKARRGGLQSAPSFGYAVKDNTLVVLPEEADVVRAIFARFVGGEGFFSIARSVNALGVKTHRGGCFESRTVEYIVRNPVYIGKLRWTPTGKTRRNFDNPDTIVADAGHYGIVSQEIWEAAQCRADALKARRHPHARPASEHRDWLSGLVKCAACGKSLVKSGDRYWKCGAYAKGMCKSSQHITDQKLKAMILTGLEKAAGGGFPLQYSGESKPAHPGSEEGRISRQIGCLAARMQKIRAAYYGGVDSLDEYRTAKSSLKAEMDALREKLALLRECADVNKKAGSGEPPGDICSILLSPDGAAEEKRRAVYAAVKSIVYDRDTATVDFVFF